MTILGPAAGQAVNYGSVPGVKSCTAVNWLNANAYNGSLWIKGHLLNVNLGGPATFTTRTSPVYACRRNAPPGVTV